MKKIIYGVFLNALMLGNNTGCIAMSSDESFSESDSAASEQHSNIHQAAMRGDVDSVIHEIEDGVSVDLQDEEGRTPLFLAIQGGWITLIDALLDRGADLTITDDNGQTALHHAIISGMNNFSKNPLAVGNQIISSVKKLMAYGADMDTMDNQCWSPIDYLFSAATPANEGFVRYFFNILCQDIPSVIAGRTLLYYAAKTNPNFLAALLSQPDVDVDVESENGATPLLAAIYEGEFKSVELLLRHGADMKAENKEKDTILHVTVMSKEENIGFLEYLLSQTFTDESGTHPLFDINAKNNDGETPLYSAIRMGNESYIPTLIQYGAKIFNADGSPVINTKGETLLHCAMMLGMEILDVQRTLFLIQNLVNSGLDINAKDYDLNTPLLTLFNMISDTYSDEEDIEKGIQFWMDIAGVLAEHGADLNASDKNLKTILHRAIESGYTRIIHYLLDKEVNVGDKDNKGKTPLHHAIELGDNDAINHLLSVPGIDVNAQDNAGRTILHYAAIQAINNEDFNSGDKLIKYLKTQGVDESIKDKDGNVWYQVYSDGGTLLHCTPDPDLALPLVKEGKINTQNKHGETPLHIAIINKNIGYMHFLLDNGADPFIKDNDGFTPLHRAAMALDVASVDALLKHVNKLSKPTFKFPTFKTLSFSKEKNNTKKFSPFHSVTSSFKSGGMFLQKAQNPLKKEMKFPTFKKASFKFTPLGQAVIGGDVENTFSISPQESSIFDDEIKSGSGDVFSEELGGMYDPLTEDLLGSEDENNTSEVLDIFAPITEDFNVPEDKNSEAEILSEEGEFSTAFNDFYTLEDENLETDNLFEPSDNASACGGDSVLSYINMLDNKKGCMTALEHAIIGQAQNESDIDETEEETEGENSLREDSTDKLFRLIDIFEHYGLDLKKRMVSGSTLLHRAVEAGNLPLIIHLVKGKGLDINALSSMGKTPLYCALKEHNTPLVIELLKLGATPDIAQADLQSHNTIFHLLADFPTEDFERIISGLSKEFIANTINLPNKQGQTPILLAAAHNSNLCNLLATRGANIYAYDDNSRTILHYASDNADSSILKQVLTIEGVNTIINTPDDHGETPLFGAIRNDNFDNAWLLMKAGARLTSIEEGKLDLKRTGDYCHNKGIIHEAACASSDMLKLIMIKLYAEIVNSFPNELVTRIDKGDISDAYDLMQQSLTQNEGAQPQMEEFVNYECKNKTPLAKAIQKKSNDPSILDNLRILVDNGADVDISDDDFVLSVFSDEKLATFFIDNDYDLTVTGSEHYTPLGCAIKKKSPKLVRELVEHGADVNQHGSWEDKTLEAAIKSENIEIVQYLINHGIDLTVEEFQSPWIHLALQTKNHAMTEFVLNGLAGNNDAQRRRTIDTADSYGVTPLYLAALSGDSAQIDYLVSAGANVNTTATPMPILHCTIFNKFRPDIIETLLSIGADINIQDKKGRTALYRAFESGNMELVDYLLDHEADILVKNKNAEDCWFAAVRSKKVEVMEKYLEEYYPEAHEEEEADIAEHVNAQNAEGNTPLHIACESGDSETISWLLQHEANPEVTNANDESPLFTAIRHGHLEAVNTIFSFYEENGHSFPFDAVMPYIEERLAEEEASGNIEMCKTLDHIQDFIRERIPQE